MTAVRFMARHGGRCPYQNGWSAEAAGSFVGRYDGFYYRVRCSPYGD